MNFLDYINSYDICAINYVPVDDAEEMRRLYPEVFPLRSSSIENHVRFVDGKWISWCDSPYSVDDYFHCEAVINFEDLSDVDMKEDVSLNINDFL